MTTETDLAPQWTDDPYWTEALAAYTAAREAGVRTITLDLDVIERRAFDGDGPAHRLLEAMRSVHEAEQCEGFRGAPRVMLALLMHLQEHSSRSLSSGSVPSLPPADEPPTLLDCWFGPTGRAIRSFADERLTKLADKIIFRMRRVPAAGVFGDYSYRTLWDEYCHELQQGPSPMRWVFERSIDPFISVAVEALERQEATLLSIGAAWEFDDYDIVFDGEIAISERLICQAVTGRIDQQAMDRSLDKFHPLFPFR